MEPLEAAREVADIGISNEDWSYRGTPSEYQSDFEGEGYGAVSRLHHETGFPLLIDVRADETRLDLNNRYVPEGAFDSVGRGSLSHQLAWAYESMEREHGSEYTEGPTPNSIGSAEIPLDFDEDSVEDAFESLSAIAEESDQLHSDVESAIDGHRQYRRDNRLLPQRAWHLGDHETEMPWE